ncbi:MAG TPA: IPT/TIG domain-containing protein, partial [Ferruginibacter sp.]|nr:IPT/TIG domain-containing protein [Ferruginibacter sp.]
WGFFPLVYIQPGEARVGLNETVDLKVMYLLSQEDWELVVLPDESPLTHPRELLPSFIKGWIFNGKGTLSPAGSRAVYKAPSSVPAQNPEAVNAEINFRKKGTYLLVANITVLGEFHIDYLDVDETEVNLPQLSHGSRLFIYGNFGNDPGTNNRAVKINNVDVSVMTWTPKIIICEIAAIGPASSGEVLVSSGGKTTSKLLNDWTVEFNYAKKESPDGALTRKTTYLMRFRGDAIGYGSGGQAPLLPYTDLNKTSRAIIEMPAASFSNSVSVSTCGTYTVKWDAIPAHVTERTLYSTGTGFRGRVYKSANGFGVKIKSLIESPLKSTRTFAPCIGAPTQVIVNEPIAFEGYHEETIWFNFTTQAARTTIKAGAPPMLVGTGVAPGLFWDAGDLNPNQFTTKIWWAETTPKFN